VSVPYTPPAISPGYPDPQLAIWLATAKFFPVARNPNILIRMHVLNKIIFCDRKIILSREEHRKLFFAFIIKFISPKLNYHLSQTTVYNCVFVSLSNTIKSTRGNFPEII
jgi:hypothetical protein